MGSHPSRLYFYGPRGPRGRYWVVVPNGSKPMGLFPVLIIKLDLFPTALGLMDLRFSVT